MYRTILFAPYVIPLVASSIAWIWMLSSNGFVNEVMGLVLPVHGVAWLDSSAWALPGIMLVTIWQFVGYYTVLVLSGLQGIPHEIEEAARIDGAGEMRLAWSVTLPLLSPTLLFCLVVSAINGCEMCIRSHEAVVIEGAPTNGKSPGDQGVLAVSPASWPVLHDHVVEPGRNQGRHESHLCHSSDSDHAGQ